MVFGRKKTLSEIQEETEYKDAEISLAQKKAILKKLKENNLSLSSFGTWRNAWEWFKTH